MNPVVEKELAALGRQCRVATSVLGSTLRVKTTLLNELIAEREATRAGLLELEAWADGYANRKSGMGAGLHSSMWPMLGPAAAKELLTRVRRLLGESEA